jgi:hypothetical protein
VLLLLRGALREGSCFLLVPGVGRPRAAFVHALVLRSVVDARQFARGPQEDLVGVWHEADLRKTIPGLEEARHCFVSVGVEGRGERARGWMGWWMSKMEVKRKEEG